MCVHNGVPYTQGQKWFDGCSKACICEDAKSGYYRCDDRCTTYTSIPSQCTLVADPKDPECCEVPQCITVPPNPTNGTIVITGVTGVVTGGGIVPTTPMPGCFYKGKFYPDGQKWQDGCDYNCECIDGMNGKYQCSQRCPSYPIIPPQCQLQRDENDLCCYKPKCDFLNPPSTPSLGPTLTPTPSPTPVAFCVYNGLPYSQGDTWNKGCSQTCRCDDAQTNYYSCYDRCPSFNNLPDGCKMVVDPNDACCEVPECPNVPTPAPFVQPTLAPGVSPSPTYPVPTLAPGIISGSGPKPDPNTGIGQYIGFCEYKGKKYHKGDTWDDACSYKCECIDEASGAYTCTERCPRFATLPQSCFMTTDPYDQCCKIPTCPSAPTPGPLGPTPSPTPKDVCMYNGKAYTQGQKWSDKCDKNCVCDDAKQGLYTCTDRCPKYDNVPSSCVMVADPNDPNCCQAPQCSNVTAGVQGSITGSGHPPTVNNMCYYKGSLYQQGQRWRDGCSYDCVCDDANTGRYTCHDICKRFPSLPSSCRLEIDPANPCCRKPNCVNPTPAPGMTPTPPLTEFCLYNGVVVKQGQVLRMGCDKTCRCDDAKSGQINCQDRCPTYQTLSQGCTLVTDPKDPCCQVPDCLNPNSTDPNTIVTGVPGTIVVSPQTGTSVTGNRNSCVYKGVFYSQGQKWDDGCTYTCECVDAYKGQYRCTEKCPRYAKLPSYCTLVEDPADKCCQKPYCTPIFTPTPPAPLPGSTTPTPIPGPAEPKYCSYKGDLYQQGQLWYDGCDLSCRCENSTSNLFRCQERCAVFNNVPVSCSLVPDPSDPSCCKIPSCKSVGTTPLVGINTPPTTVAPGVITGIGKIPTPSPGLPPQPGCIYKGTQYSAGQKWDDGCDYSCECVNGMTGQYKCTQKCTRYIGLPPQCQLITDPFNKCCKIPYCDYSKNPTPRPIIPPTQQPGQPIPITVAPETGFCSYKGVYYTQGQTWSDGCDRNCRCEEPSKGLITCTNKCKIFNNLPSSCRLVTDPKDACCLVPDCNKYPTPAPPLPPQLGITTTPVPIVVPTSVAGSFTGSNQYPNVGFGGTSKRNVCVYKGVIYNQGNTWTDGCDYSCQCIDAENGLYKCTDRCQNYYNLPPQCYKVYDPNDKCCTIAKCDFNYNATTPVPPTTPTTTATISISISTIKPMDQCLYVDGSLYAKGATWNVGCDYVCTCEDPTTNKYKCNARCQGYSGLPSVCTLQPDPNDQCCEKPDCGSYTPSIDGPITPSPNALNIFPIGTHNSFTGTGWQPGTFKPPTFGGRNVCIYNGNIYNQGQSWDDGCKYVCTCENANSGVYRCTSKCPHFSQSLPSYCRLVNVPGQCCQSMTCDVPGYGTYNPIPQLNPTPAPGKPPGSTMLPPNTNIQITTPAPVNVFPGQGYPINSAQIPQVTNQCIFQNKVYNQGETWDQDCKFSCECKDGRSGYFECKSKCPTYKDIQKANCFSVQATGLNGDCCESIKCPDSNGNIVSVDPNHPSQFPIYGTFQPGYSGFRPNYQPPSSGLTGSSNGCVYKGVSYAVNQKWDDGCDFSCTCTDSSGLYTCTSKCPTYTSLPSYCHLEAVTGQCCKVVRCGPANSVTTTLTTPHQGHTVAGCQDLVSDCASYGHSACTGTYKDWAQRNCPAFCNMCHHSTVTTPPPQCNDKSLCTSLAFKPWAQQNCPNFDQLCQGPTTTSVPCVDKDSPSLCQSAVTNGFCSQFASVRDRCAKSCGVCTVATTPSTSTAPPSGWQLLFKGVENMGGDLFQLWAGGQTINPLDPTAANLFPQKPYKPDLSNHWNSLCLDKIKVSIYKHGVEKAYIVFDARNSDKLNWFSSDRIIDSSWGNIASIPKQFIGMQTDPSTGLQFSVTQTSQQCSTTGWIMVTSPQSNCFYEKGLQKPSFFYSMTNTAVNWGSAQKGMGDVFAIQGHSTCSNGSTTTPVPPPTGCTYKGTLHQEGDMWSDGCEKNCTCPKDQSGIAQCFPRCPVYQGLPSQCHVVKQPGQCCGQVYCNFTGMITCNYKGTDYVVGDKWDDGCDLSCECLANGAYSCKQKCVNHWNIPKSICSLAEPEPGCCCQVPKCPSYVVIQYPQGYGPEVCTPPR